jgi:phosphatidylserine decarboxylase
LECRRTGKKSSHVSGEILLQFSIFDPIHASATPQHILNKLGGIVASSSPTLEDEEDPTLDRTDSADFSADEDGAQEDVPGEKKKKRLRLARLKKKATMRAYEFGSGSDIAGVLFLEVTKITDLPPEKNSKRQPCIVRNTND